jgi:hypothetical protein
VFEDGERHTSSRIDDIMLCGVHSGVSARQRDDTATLSDHVPLIAHRHNGNRPVYPQPQGRAQHGKPRVLAQPISKGFGILKARIAKRDGRAGKAIKSLSTELTNLLSAGASLDSNRGNGRQTGDPPHQAC